MSTAFRGWPRSTVAALVVLMLVLTVPLAGPSVTHAQTHVSLQTHV